MQLKLASFAPEIQNLPPCAYARPSYADRCQQHVVIFKRTARLSRIGFKIVLFDKETFDQRYEDSNLWTFIKEVNSRVVMAALKTRNHFIKERQTPTLRLLFKK